MHILSFFGNPIKTLCPSAPSICDKCGLTRISHILTRHLNKLFCGLAIRNSSSTGLGGGSSNAATVLWGINELLGCPQTNDELKELAACVGSDVPFFFSLGSAICSGRGEEVKNCLLTHLPSISLALPNIHMNTKQVYHNFSASHKLESDANSIPKDIDQFFNDLEEPAFKLSPELKKIKNALQNYGYKKVLMTGSGSTMICFGEAAIPKDAICHISKCSSISRYPNEWYH